MIALYIILGIVLFFALIFSLKIKVYLRLEDELRVRAGVGPVVLTLVPSKPKKPLNAKDFTREKHEKRLARICAHWDDILKITEEELPAAETLKSLLEELGAPCTPAEIGLPDGEIPAVFRATLDIRDKYILSTLAWDLGILEDIAEAIN